MTGFNFERPGIFDGIWIFMIMKLIGIVDEILREGLNLSRKTTVIYNDMEGVFNDLIQNMGWDMSIDQRQTTADYLVMGAYDFIPNNFDIFAFIMWGRGVDDKNTNRIIVTFNKINDDETGWEDITLRFINFDLDILRTTLSAKLQEVLKQLANEAANLVERPELRKTQKRTIIYHISKNGVVSVH